MSLYYIGNRLTHYIYSIYAKNENKNLVNTLNEIHSLFYLQRYLHAHKMFYPEILTQNLNTPFYET